MSIHPSAYFYRPEDEITTAVFLKNCSWNFKTANYDIGFALVYNDEEEGSADEELFACARADSHLHVQRGAITAENAGTCKSHFYMPPDISEQVLCVICF